MPLPSKRGSPSPQLKGPHRSVGVPSPQLKGSHQIVAVHHPNSMGHTEVWGSITPTFFANFFTL